MGKVGDTVRTLIFQDRNLNSKCHLKKKMTGLQLLHAFLNLFSRILDDLMYSYSKNNPLEISPFFYFHFFLLFNLNEMNVKLS